MFPLIQVRKTLEVLFEKENKAKGGHQPPKNEFFN